MIHITLTSTGFFADKPRVDVLSFDEQILVVDTTKQKTYLGQLRNDEIQLWFEKTHLINMPIKDRLLQIQITRNHDT